MDAQMDTEQITKHELTQNSNSKNWPAQAQPTEDACVFV